MMPRLILLGVLVCHVQSWSQAHTRQRSCFHLPTALHLENARHQQSPLLAIVTEPDACTSSTRLEETYDAVSKAVSTNQVSLVSIRLNPSESPDVLERALDLTKRMVALADRHAFRVVCSSDWVPVALQAGAHGVHVKEAHLSRVPEIRRMAPEEFLIGTSTHNLESALTSLRTFKPDYYFVGTCFMTASHPEKSLGDLEGPELPGEVRRAIPIDTESGILAPAVFAIGGIDESNCRIPIYHGANGVAVIRSVLHATDPAAMVSRLTSRMTNS